jgi:hypothetical protein
MKEPVVRGTRELGLYIDVTSGTFVFCLVKGLPNGRIIMEAMEADHPMRTLFQHISTKDLKQMVDAIAPARDVA